MSIPNKYTEIKIAYVNDYVFLCNLPKVIRAGPINEFKIGNFNERW